MSEENNKHCYCCKHYKPYYTKGYIQFDKSDIGLCAKNKDTVKKEYYCDNYSFLYHGRIVRREAALSAVITHVDALSQLKQILEEDDEEEIKELFLNFRKRKR